MLISVVTGPATAAAELDAVRDHLRLDHHEDNDYIANLIDAAATRVEEYTGRRLITQTLDLLMGAAALARAIPLPIAPVTAVTEIVVTGVSGQTTVDAADYELVTVSGPTAGPSIVQLMRDKAWPAADTSTPYPARVRVTAGYGDLPSDVPDGLRQAMYAIIGGWYESRQDWVQGGAPGVYANSMVSESIMDPYRLAWAF